VFGVEIKKGTAGSRLHSRLCVGWCSCAWTGRVAFASPRTGGAVPFTS